MSPQSLGGINHANVDEYETSSTYCIPLQIWIDRPCGYPFRDDHDCGHYSFQQDFLPPNHLHWFHFMIDCMSIYSHDYVLKLSLLYYMIKHRGTYLDEMVNRWLH